MSRTITFAQDFATETIDEQHSRREAELDRRESAIQDRERRLKRQFGPLVSSARELAKLIRARVDESTSRGVYLSYADASSRIHKEAAISFTESALAGD
jgi:hypothetical protein